MPEHFNFEIVQLLVEQKTLYLNFKEQGNRIRPKRKRCAGFVPLLRLAV
jgi:hypothetical protein